MQLTRRSFAVGATGAGLTGGRIEPRMRGVSLAGLEFNNGVLPGRRDTDFVAPSPEAVDYYADRGASLIRLPFLWERLQPHLNGPFEAGYLGAIQQIVDRCAARDMRIVLDAHQYGRRRVSGEARIIGESLLVGSSSFSAFWGSFARMHRDRPHVIFGLQNEPHDQDSPILLGVCNAAIAAIREAGCAQLILVPGNAWSGGHSWVSSGNARVMRGVHDAARNFAFDVHQYLDADSSGTHDECLVGAATARLEGFTMWARRNGARGFLGEFGAGRNDVCLREIESLLEFIDKNESVWLGWAYWAGGPWWGENYAYSVEPQEGRDRPQMSILRRHF